MDHRELARRIALAREKYDTLKCQSNQAWAEYLELIREIGPEVMGDVEKVTISGLGTLSKSSKMSVKTTDRPALMAWLHDKGFGALCTETVNSSTLAGFVREQIRNGDEVPDACIVMTTYDEVKFKPE